jgi:hypothetical protein
VAPISVTEIMAEAHGRDHNEKFLMGAETKNTGGFGAAHKRIWLIVNSDLLILNANPKHRCPKVFLAQT